MGATAKPVLGVAVGVLINQRDEVLIAQRPADKHMGGAWEFPGGKIEATESVLEALMRELNEELSIQVLEASDLMTHRHEYSDRIVDLHVMLVTEWSGASLAGRGAEGQSLRWVTPENLMKSGVLPADQPIADRLIERFG